MAPWSHPGRVPFSEVYNRRDAVGGQKMLWAVLLVGAAGLASGYMTERAVIPKLQHRPGTPLGVVQNCREAVVAQARAHANEQGARLLRVDATSAGPMQRTRNGYSAPVEVGIVYSRPSGREARQGIIECRLNQQGHPVIAEFAGAAR